MYNRSDLSVLYHLLLFSIYCLIFQILSSLYSTSIRQILFRANTQTFLLRPFYTYRRHIFALLLMVEKFFNKNIKFAYVSLPASQQAHWSSPCLAIICGKGEWRKSEWWFLCGGLTVLPESTRHPVRVLNSVLACTVFCLWRRISRVCELFM